MEGGEQRIIIIGRQDLPVSWSAINNDLNKEEASWVCVVLYVALRVEEHFITACKESY